MKPIHFISLLFVCLMALACKSSMGGAQLGPKPSALGKMNEIVVIADEELWQGAIGDTFKFYFGSAYPIMPTPEPIFDLRHFTPKQLKEQGLRKELRTYVILADLNDTNSSTTTMVATDLGQIKYEKSLNDQTFNTSVGKDKWAKGQVLFYLFANGEKKLAEVIAGSFSAIATKVNEHDEKQLSQSAYVDAANMAYSKLMIEKYGVDIKIPLSFRKAIGDEDLTWFRKDDGEYILNLVFDKRKYSNQKQLSPDAIKKWINGFGQAFVTSDEKGSVLVVNDEDLPIFDYTKEIQGAFTTELRGTWEMTKDFYAGPFFAYSILNEKDNEVIYALAFIAAPGKDKRDRMQQLEYMIHSLEWTD